MLWFLTSVFQSACFYVSKVKLFTCLHVNVLMCFCYLKLGRNKQNCLHCIDIYDDDLHCQNVSLFSPTILQAIAVMYELCLWDKTSIMLDFLFWSSFFKSEYFPKSYSLPFTLSYVYFSLTLHWIKCSPKMINIFSKQTFPFTLQTDHNRQTVDYYPPRE